MVKKYSNSSVLIAALICIILIYSGLIKVKDPDTFFSLIPTSQVEKLKGQLLSSPARSADGKFYSAKMKVWYAYGSRAGSSAGGNVLVYIPSALAEAYFPGKLYSKAVKKGNSKGHLWEAGGRYFIKGSFNQEGKNFYISECLFSDFPKTLYGSFDYFRALCRLQFKRLMYSWGAAGGLLLALLCGAKEYTSLDISSAFRNAGLSHILALSGMHLSMFSGIDLFFGKKIGRKKLSFIIRIIALILFVWFAGLSPSLLRAFICSLLMIIAALANVKKPDMLMILAFSFLCQTIIAPEHLFNTGFILSYSALAGILVFNKFFQQLYMKFLPGYFANSLASSTGAQIFTAPLSLGLFGSFAPIGVIATSIVSPFVTIFIYSGLALIILCLFIPPLALPSGIFINLQYTIINFLVAFFSKAIVWRIN